MENVTTPESGPTEAPEMVEIPDADDADLEAFINDPRNFAEDDDEDDQPGPKQQPEPAKPQPEAPAQQPDKAESVDERIARMQKQLEGLERINQRRASDLGELKRQVKELVAQKRKALEDAVTPGEAAELAAEIKQSEQQLHAIDHEAAMLEHAKATAELVKGRVDFEKVSLEDMAECLREDDVNPQFIAAFMANPFASAQGAEIIHLAKRAESNKLLRQLMGYTRQLFEENKKLKAKPDEVLKNVAKASRQAPGITGASGGSGGSERSLADVDVTQLSDDELRALLKN